MRQGESVFNDWFTKFPKEANRWQSPSPRIAVAVRLISAKPSDCQTVVLTVRGAMRDMAGREKLPEQRSLKKILDREKIMREDRSDVLIIGGGIAGIATALDFFAGPAA